MSKAVITSTTGLPPPAAAASTNRLRRALLTGGAVAVAAMATGVAASAGAASVSPDAELIRVCQQFAETELTNWYRYIVAPDGEGGFQETSPDWATLRRITETPALTLEGWRAKALVYSVWNMDAFDDPEDERCPATSLLASLLRDAAAPARAAIVARLVERHGPLPGSYTADAVWLGRAAA